MNRDRTIDSICPRCYATVGSSTSEVELEQMEAAHVCDAGQRDYFDREREKAIKRARRQEPSQQVEAIRSDA